MNQVRIRVGRKSIHTGNTGHRPYIGRRIALVVLITLGISAGGVGAGQRSRFLAKVDAVTSVIPGDTVALRLHISPAIPDSGIRLGEVDLSLDFDSSALSLIDLRMPDSLVSCGWSPPRFYMAYPGTANCGSAQLQIILRAGEAWFNSTCSTISAIEILLQFLTKTDSVLHDDTALVQFCWKTCEDNRLGSRDGDTLLTVNNVLSWIGDTLTDIDAQLPTIGGLNQLCRETLFLTGQPHDSGVDFHGGAVVFGRKPVAGEVGDINLDGRPYDVADLSLLGTYCLKGAEVLQADPSLQFSASDIDADGVPGTVADWVALRYEIMGDVGLPTHRTSSMASLVLLPEERATGVYIEAGEATNAYAIWLKAPLSDFDSVVFAQSCDTSAHEAALVYINDTVVHVAFSAGDVAQPAFPPGYHRLFTVFHSAGAALETAKIEAATNEPSLFTMDIATGTPPGPDGHEILPNHFKLEQNYPNPFNPGTYMRFSLSKPASWTLEIFDVAGRNIRQFSDRNYAGEVSVYWDGRSGDGRPVSSGIYFYRIVIGNDSQTKKMLLLR